MLDIDILGRCLQQLGSDGDQLEAHRPGRQVGRRAADDSGPAPSRSSTSRRRVGVAVHDHDVIDVDTDLVSGDLGHRRGDALTVATGTQGHRHLAAEGNPDLSGFVPDQGAGAKGGRLHEEGDPDSDPSAGGPGGTLFLPEPVVVEAIECPLQ